MGAQFAFGQGGPPMITDDPGTPGNGKWENNFAIAFEHRPGETSYDLPAIDLNYGIGDHIQLTLQTAPVLLKRSGHGAIGGIGSPEAALKWRFVDEEAKAVDISMFPRIIFNVVQPSVRRGLSEEGHTFPGPSTGGKEVRSMACGRGVRPARPTVGRNEWLYGTV